MLRLLFISALTAAAASALIGTSDAAGTQRHLVYNFTVGIRDDQSEASSANGFTHGRGSADAAPVTSNGTNSYIGQASDRGEVAVDVSGIQPDGGLVVVVSENAHGQRSAAPATCVVYANTNVACGSSNVNPEEIAVLRTLSPKFFDASQLDAQRHWAVENKDAGVAINFTVTPAGNGMLDIAADRNETIQGQNKGTIHTTDAYVYDMAHFVPDSIKEYVTYRQEQNAGVWSTTTVDITAQLASDSAPK